MNAFVYFFCIHISIFIHTTIGNIFLYPNHTFSDDYCMNNTDYKSCSDYWEINDNKTIIYKNSQKWIRNILDNDSINDIRLMKMFHKLQNDQDILIYVFGGSLTAGRMVNGISGAWPAEFAKRWNQYKTIYGYHGNIIIKNLAVGGTISKHILDHLSIHFHNSKDLIDLIILDYDVNDCIVYDVSNEKSRISYLSEIEILMRRLLLLKSEPAILYYNVAISTKTTANHGLKSICMDYQKCYQMGEVKKPVMDYYNISIISQKHAIWSNFSCPPKSKYWDCTKTCTHPSYNGHRTMAMIMWKYFSTFYKITLLYNTNITYTSSSSLSSSMPNTNNLWNPINDTTSNVQNLFKDIPFLFYKSIENNKIICNDYTTIIDTETSIQFDKEYLRDYDNVLINNRKNPSNLVKEYNNTSRNNNNFIENNPKLIYKHPCWEFKQDIDGKEMGWIIDRKDCFNTGLIFQITFGNHYPHLLVSYLATYNRNFGIVQVSISEPIQCIFTDDHNYSNEDNEDKSKLCKVNANDQIHYNISNIHYHILGYIDGYRENNDDGYDYSINEGIQFFDYIYYNSIQYIKLKFINANIPPWISIRDQIEKYPWGHPIIREIPQKIKIMSLFAC